LTIQQEALANSDLENIILEYVCGTSTQGRDELNTLHNFLREGNELIVTRVDRLAQSLLDLVGVFAEFETNLRKERRMDGIAQTKERGVYAGRKGTIDVEKVNELKSSGMGASAIVR